MAKPTNIKEQILLLREQGKSYREIERILGCSKSTVAYHLSDEQKEKAHLRNQKHRSNQHPYAKKLEAFRASKRSTFEKQRLHKAKKLIQLKIETFHRGDNRMTYAKPTFTIDDVISKFGENPKCYLTGKQLNIHEPRTYAFDHILPVTRGGDNSIDNLGLCSKEANQAKFNMTNEEFFALCKQVLEHNGYEVKQK